MKTKMLAFLLLVSFGVFAKDDKYEAIMAKNIDLVFKAQTIEELQQVANVFDRVGNAEKSKWEPYYYASFGYVMMATREKNNVKKDAFLDQAKASIDKATALKENDSEIVAMEGFISMIRVSVDPAARGMKYSPMAIQSFNKAVALDPENPRAMALLAQMQVGMSKFFNAPPTEGCESARKALEKFASFKSDNPLAPKWGKGMTEELAVNCK